jgi:predicted helicase
MEQRIKASHKPVQEFLRQRAQLVAHGVTHEMGVRSAFQMLLHSTTPKGWALIPEETLPKSSLRPDGTLKDEFLFRRGFWESKDEHDDLQKEIDAKVRKGYPLTNTIFEDSREAVLYQNKRVTMMARLDDPRQVADLLNNFYDYREPHIEEFEKAVEEFKDRVPDLAAGLVKKIEQSHRDNREFRDAFSAFHELCRTSLNPGLRQEAVEEMLVQHLLTERLIGNIFENPEFRQRNVIAAEIEKVVGALTGRHFNRQQYLEGLNRFYVAIEKAAQNSSEFSEKQHLLNSVYERFFQGYAVKVADTHGIVYTPQPIVDFMCASVVEVLKSEFGKELGDREVCIIDPCTGTGNFIVNLMPRIPQKDLPRMYRQQLFANEVMLMPYYIAALNIEHAYFEITGKYEPFEGLCFVDTLGMADAQQQALFTEKNVERVERQKKAQITVVLGNPPYNANQINESDNNRNRKYGVVDKRVEELFARTSSATLKSKIYDPYVKFFRWATDRLENRQGLVCFVSNNSFVHKSIFDGMRETLAKEFSAIEHVDLKGDLREDLPDGEKSGNVFGIKVGVGITILAKNPKKSICQFSYCLAPDSPRKQDKLQWLEETESIRNVCWTESHEVMSGIWKKEEKSEFSSWMSLSLKDPKLKKDQIFSDSSLGVSTNRDDVVYGFEVDSLLSRVEDFADKYNSELVRYQRRGMGTRPDDFVDHSKVRWSSTLKGYLSRGQKAAIDEAMVRRSLYRPFCAQNLYYDYMFVDRPGRFRLYQPTLKLAKTNPQLLLLLPYDRRDFTFLMTHDLPNLNCLGDPVQCFPFYVYDEDGKNRRENVTDWALGEFRGRYEVGGMRYEKGEKPEVRSQKSEGKAKMTPPLKRGGKMKRDGQRPPPVARGGGEAETRRPEAAASSTRGGEIGKWDIFYYVYGLLHHPEYRARYADNLKRELPRIPFAPDFWAFSVAGRKLAELHLKYEELEPYKLKFVETPKTRLSWRVEKMKLVGENPKSKIENRKEKKQSGEALHVRVNETLMLSGIPAEVQEYRLGNRSALDWVIDQYQIKTDKRSGITHDPNREDDPEYIVRLIGQVVRVSLETVKIVKGLPKEFR